LPGWSAIAPTGMCIPWSTLSCVDWMESITYGWITTPTVGYTKEIPGMYTPISDFSFTWLSTGP
jgi:hypothetical protein